jgi:hypothetical protein
MAWTLARTPGPVPNLSPVAFPGTQLRKAFSQVTQYCDLVLTDRRLDLGIAQVRNGVEPLVVSEYEEAVWFAHGSFLPDCSPRRSRAVVCNVIVASLFSAADAVG